MPSILAARLLLPPARCSAARISRRALLSRFRSPPRDGGRRFGTGPAGGRRPTGPRRAGRVRPRWDRHRPEYGPLDEIAQLSYVAGPAVAAQPVERRRGQPGRPPAQLAEEMLHQLRNVVGAIPQRRHVQGKDQQPVVEILAEGAVGDGPSRGAVSWRRSRARSTCRSWGSPTRLIFFSSSTRSSLAWIARPASPISSRNSVPPQAASNRPSRVAVGSGEGALAVAEQLALEQALGDGRAVDGDERTGRAPAGAMDRLGRDLLARTRSRPGSAPSRPTAPRGRSSRAASTWPALRPGNPDRRSPPWPASGPGSPARDGRRPRPGPPRG